MKLMRDTAWTRRGCSLLWCPSTLVTFAEPSEVASIRTFFVLARSWPEDLPSNNGRALVVAGLEGCLDALSPDDAATWIEQDLDPQIFAFQDEYQGDAALVFWLPSGRGRVRYELASGDYYWVGRADAHFPLGRLLWAGAEGDAQRILTGDLTADPDGDAWVGMYHPRIS
ncbi:MAG: hypothetical protein HYV63_33295 [Candidatus Schekmanbacteria bacterium]|nr:hypothetical protein [Candidatus Schekmanbacteria bacterium]